MILDVHSHSKKVVCYVATWAFYRKSGSYDLFDKFNPDLCTHLIYSFAVLNDETHEIKSRDVYLDLEDNYGKGAGVIFLQSFHSRFYYESYAYLPGWYTKSTGLKHLYPHLTVLLAIGGWSEGSEKYSKMAQSQENRSKFVQSALAFMR